MCTQYVECNTPCYALELLIAGSSLLKEMIIAKLTKWLGEAVRSYLSSVNVLKDDKMDIFVHVSDTTRE
jgi:hypothetical protein